MNDHPMRQLSAKGEPKPTTSIERTCGTCGASSLGLAPGKTGEAGLWSPSSFAWFCSIECAPKSIRPASGPLTDDEGKDER